MAKLFVFVVLFVVVFANEDNPEFPKVACDGENNRAREMIIDQSKCGEPKEVFVLLDSKVAHEQISPSAVWVKRCAGLCEYDNEGSCVHTATVVKQIPIRIFNAQTNKESCATYPVEEHVSCGCGDAHTQTEQGTCQCPNMDERRKCLKKIRIFNAQTNKESCATYPVEEHVSCGCGDAHTQTEQGTCQCPNMDERRKCLKKKMRWNRSKCQCEKIRKVF